MVDDYFSRRVTQSQYRGGKPTNDDDIVYLDLSLAPLDLTEESVKEGVRKQIRQQSQDMVRFLLDESYHAQVRQPTYINKIFTQLDL